MKKIVLILLTAALLLTAGCTTVPNRYQAQFLSLFDTVTTIVGYADSEADFSELAQSIHDELEIYHQFYDIYNDYEGINNIKTINDNAGVAPVTVDSRIIDLLLFSQDMYDKTGGSVNVALGSVLAVWHNYREAGIDDPLNAEVPPMALLEEAALHTNINDIVIDEQASTVFLRDSEMRLDVGAVAKGYAAERVISAIEASGVQSLLVSIGGNVKAIGQKLVAGSNGEKRWNIGIQNPDKTSEQTEILHLLIDGLSIVSSGIYERYYTVDGVRYHHIIDPATLFPADTFEQVTIVCADSGLADALSTAVFNMTLDDGRALINSLDGIEAAWVLQGGTLEYSAGFQALIAPD